MFLNCSRRRLTGMVGRPSWLPIAGVRLNYGMPWTRPACPGAELVVRGMGFKDGAEDVRGFRRALADGRVTPIPSLLLRSAMAEARTISDPAGNAKLSKSTQGRPTSAGSG